MKRARSFEARGRRVTVLYVLSTHSFGTYQAYAIFGRGGTTKDQITTSSRYEGKRLRKPYNRVKRGADRKPVRSFRDDVSATRFFNRAKGGGNGYVAREI